MKSVRIEPEPNSISGGPEILVDVVCDCGKNGLENVATGEKSFKHRIRISSRQVDVMLECKCGKRYVIHPQPGHIHIETLK